MQTRRHAKLRIVAAVLVIVFLFLSTLVGYLFICSETSDFDVRTLPSYDRIDITPLLAKPRSSLTDEERRTLSLQTGVFSQQSLEEESNERLLKFQDALFFRGKPAHEEIAITTDHDILIDPATGAQVAAPIVTLQPGDILVTSTCHTFGWRNGHAAIVLKGNRLLQSFSLGYDSDICSANNSSGVKWFCGAANFIVLRLKGADEDERAELAVRAEEELNGVPYSLGVGLTMAKDQGTSPKATNCSHLVWQVYKNAGYDIDADGGSVVTCRDIANSPQLEVVQIYGFDPIKGW